MFQGTFLEERVYQLSERFKLYEEKGYSTTLKEIQHVNNSPWAIVEGEKKLILTSYSYLGLLGDRRIQAAADDAMVQFGTGTHGVRLLTGSLALHHELEEEIAAFKQAEAAAVFSSGYATNISLFSCLAGKGDVVICDRFAHKSIIDGVLLSGAELVYFRHNDMVSLKDCLETHRGRNIIVAVDGVYSMDGDIANLPEIIPLCKRYQACLMVDEAHSLGTIGKTGRGVEEHFHLSPDDIDIKMGTLSKAIPAVGGYVAGNADLIYAVKYNSSAFLFSAAASPVAIGAALEALRILRREPDRVARLQQNTETYRNELKRLGFNTLKSESPVVPIVIEKDIPRTGLFSTACFQSNLFASGIAYPAVPKELPRLRTVVTSAFSDSDISFALEVLAREGRKLGII